MVGRPNYLREDRPRDGQRHLYRQLDEYEEAAVVTGLWSLNPANGDLRMMNHLTELGVHHERLQIQATDDGSRDERTAKVTLRAGVTNFLKVVVEPITEASKMRHR